MITNATVSRIDDEWWSISIQTTKPPAMGKHLIRLPNLRTMQIDEEQPVRIITPAPHLKKCWINQPSSLQPDHEWHGLNVFVMDSDPEDDYCQAYFLSPNDGNGGDTRIAKLSLSEGWRT